MPFTKGFNTPQALTLHFVKHRAQLGVATEAEYLEMADTFLGGDLAPGVAECNRVSNAARLRFHQGDQGFGVLFSDNVICTFYRLNPPPRDMAWFKKQCAQ